MTEVEGLCESHGKDGDKPRAASGGSPHNDRMRGGRLVLIMVVGAACFVLVFQVLSSLE
ncbi:MAG: hypothetical protein OXI51_03185 [Chloroflexota bacterium]|nr:hypothetical protein [Chloroflexota bacterium]